MKQPDLTGRIALVTGASRGIGYFIAKHMAAAGSHVIAVARTVGGLEELDDEIKAGNSATGKGSATLVPLDLTDMTGIDRLGGSINERWGKLDIMVANAGVLGTISPIGHVEAKTFDKVMNINVTSTWRLIRSLDPLLRASDAGRAILMSSGAAHSARAFWGPYAASKAAVEALGRSWATKPRTRSCASTWSIPAPRVPRCARRRCRARTPAPCPIRRRSRQTSCRWPIQGLQETGLIWRARDKVWTHYRMPE
jgi:NAD(P)-dependent dehydrogenase (short-subunit alcohol dehydrogenase family)